MVSSEIFDMLGIDAGLVILALAAAVVILLIILIVLLVKVNHLTKRYDLFMRGKDCETLEDNLVDIYRKIQAMQNKDLANKDIIKMLNRNMINTIQKTGLVKYNAFDGMGGQSSFALTLLNLENTGYILNAVHNRDSCYLYVKEVQNGEPENSLTREEKMALDKAMEKNGRVFSGGDREDETGAKRKLRREKRKRRGEE